MLMPFIADDGRTVAYVTRPRDSAKACRLRQRYASFRLLIHYLYCHYDHFFMFRQFLYSSLTPASSQFLRHVSLFALYFFSFFFPPIDAATADAEALMLIAA